MKYGKKLLSKYKNVLKGAFLYSKCCLIKKLQGPIICLYFSKFATLPQKCYVTVFAKNKRSCLNFYEGPNYTIFPTRNQLKQYSFTLLKIDLWEKTGH